MVHLAAQLNQLDEADLAQVIAICQADDYVAGNASKRDKVARLIAWAGKHEDRLAQIRVAIAVIGGAPPGPPPPARPSPQLTLQDMARDGLLNELIVVYLDRTSAITVLLAVGYPQHLIPSVEEPRAFWLEVCKHIANGATPGVFEPLLAQAAEDYPENPVFAPYRRGGAP